MNAKIIYKFHKYVTNYVFTIYRYVVEFSKPKNTKPIPEGTVKVFFSVMEVENGEEGEHEIEFNFESESLKHRVGNTMRSNMYEVSYLHNSLIIIT